MKDSNTFNPKSTFQQETAPCLTEGTTVLTNIKTKRVLIIIRIIKLNS